MNAWPGCSLAWDERPAVCVVLAAGGYPGSYEKGHPISGLDTLRDWAGGVVFHAGTAKQAGRFVTNGGRVLGVTGCGHDFQAALAGTYRVVEQLRWPDVHYRRDIGWRALQHAGYQD